MNTKLNSLLSSPVDLWLYVGGGGRVGQHRLIFIISFYLKKHSHNLRGTVIQCIWITIACSVCSVCVLSRVQLFATLYTVASPAPLSMGFSRQEHWSGLLCPPPGDLSNPGIKCMSPVSPAMQGKIYCWAIGKAQNHCTASYKFSIFRPYQGKVNQNFWGLVLCISRFSPLPKVILKGSHS